MSNVEFYFELHLNGLNFGLIIWSRLANSI